MEKEQFKNKYVGKVVHCDTFKKAKEFLKLAHDCGFEWVFGENKSLLDRYKWEDFEDETCYIVRTDDKMTYGSINYYETEGIEIVEFENEEKKVKRTKKVFDLGLFVDWSVRENESKDSTLFSIKEWALECHGLTKKEMSKIGWATHNILVKRSRSQT